MVPCTMYSGWYKASLFNDWTILEVIAKQMEPFAAKVNVEMLIDSSQYIYYYKERPRMLWLCHFHGL